jgi:hypothetical protein
MTDEPFKTSLLSTQLMSDPLLNAFFDQGKFEEIIGVSDRRQGVTHHVARSHVTLPEEMGA